MNSLILADSSSQLLSLTVDDTGILHTAAVFSGPPVTQFLNTNGNTATWSLTISTIGLLQTASVVLNPTNPSLFLTSISGATLWLIAVNTNGELTTIAPGPNAIVTGKLISDSGAPIVGANVTFTLNMFQSAGWLSSSSGPWSIPGVGILDIPNPIVTTTNSSGIFSVILWGNDVIMTPTSENDSYYNVTFGSINAGYVFLQNTNYNLLTAVPIV